MLFSIFIFVCAGAQEKGIHFEQGISWEAVLGKAGTENKYIFVDCYTTWCGPCKRMSDSIYMADILFFDLKTIYFTFK